ncbi:hypothetical protein MNBD_GAMMA24-1157 [hydrothermal vent metagenome]|uniref:Uncharacterized protein n=1 Tax=hydrothermal vent metagenome TaxID=652676 RepID=A0A3B1BRD4_9ZZZZ
MRSYRFVYLLLGLCFCSAASAAVRQDLKGTVLIFDEYEQDVDPYQTRVIVTANYMRFDDGKGSTDFVLFDRRANIIFNVNSSDQTVISVAPQAVKVVPPFKLTDEAHKLDDMKAAPSIAGIKPQHYVFSTNQQHCYDVVAVKGLFTNVLTATRAFNAILASQNAVALENLPADQQEPCDLSHSIFSYNRYLQFGFPIREWDTHGKGRALANFRENVSLNKNLFVLPPGYKRFSVKDFRAGKVQFGN